MIELLLIPRLGGHVRGAVYERAPCDPFCTLGDQCFGCHGWLVMDWFWVAGDDPDSVFGE